MVKNQKVKNIYDDFTIEVDYEETIICPICKTALTPRQLSVFAHASATDPLHLTRLDYCPICNNGFITKYLLSNKRYSDKSIKSGMFYSSKVIYCEPSRFKKQDFDKHISSLSYQFDKIYNQALAAEAFQLDEIAGLGYRKALEFLIKDFAIHESPENQEKIKSMPLSQCIKNYIKNDNIKTLAERSVWIGNDEAHYVRKQEGRDVSDMKNFIQATVYFIGMILLTEDATSIDPK